MQQTQFSRLTAQDRLRGVKAVGSMIIHLTVTIVIGGPRLLRGVRHMCLDGTRIGAIIVVSAGIKSTQGNRASTRGLSSFKAWSSGTEHTEKTLAEIIQVAVECMFLVPSVSAEPSGQQ